MNGSLGPVKLSELIAYTHVLTEVETEIAAFRSKLYAERVSPAMKALEVKVAELMVASSALEDVADAEEVVDVYKMKARLITVEQFDVIKEYIDLFRITDRNRDGITQTEMIETMHAKFPYIKRSYIKDIDRGVFIKEYCINFIA